MLHRNDVHAVLYSLVAVFLFSITASAQVDRGAIVGTVTDQAGARIAGAEVTVTNVGTNQATRFVTNEEGAFSANLLRVGTYTVTAERKGFQKTL